MAWLAENPMVWLALIVLALILLFSLLLLLSYLLEHFGVLCDKFNEWVNDEIELPSFIVFGIFLTPVYIITSTFGYVGRLCDVFNRLMNSNSNYEKGEGWVSSKKRIFNFLLSALYFSFAITIVSTVVMWLLNIIDWRKIVTISRDIQDTNVEDNPFIDKVENILGVE